MASPGHFVSLTSVKEALQRNEVVYYFAFRYSVGKERNDRKQIHAQIEELGWKKVPDLESTFVWLGKHPRTDDAVEILKKSAYENYTCRYMMGPLSEVGVLQGTGVSPEQREKANGASNTKILDYFSTPKAAKRDNKGSPSEIVPRRMPLPMDEESDSN